MPTREKSPKPLRSQRELKPRGPADMEGDLPDKYLLSALTEKLSRGKITWKIDGSTWGSCTGAREGQGPPHSPRRGRAGGWKSLPSSSSGSSPSSPSSSCSPGVRGGREVSAVWGGNCHRAAAAARAHPWVSFFKTFFYTCSSLVFILLNFLAVHNSSIGDLVTDWLTN